MEGRATVLQYNWWSLYCILFYRSTYYLFLWPSPMSIYSIAPKTGRSMRAKFSWMHGWGPAFQNSHPCPVSSHPALPTPPSHPTPPPPTPHHATPQTSSAVGRRSKLFKFHDKLHILTTKKNLGEIYRPIEPSVKNQYLIIMLDTMQDL